MPALRLQAFRVCNRQKGKSTKYITVPTLSHKSTRPTRDQKKIRNIYAQSHRRKIQLDVLRAEGRVKATGNDVEKRKKNYPASWEELIKCLKR